MPSVARVAALAVCGLLAGLGASACGSNAGRATGFCATVRQPNKAFNAIDNVHAPQALAAFDRVAAKAPPAVAADLRIVSSFQRVLRSDPKEIVKHPSLITQYGEAAKRVDAYLHDTCGIRIPPFGKLF